MTSGGPLQPLVSYDSVILLISFPDALEPSDPSDCILATNLTSHPDHCPTDISTLEFPFVRWRQPLL